MFKSPHSDQRTPLKSSDFRGGSYSLSIAAQDLKAVAEIRRLIVIFTKLYYNWLTVGLCAAKAAVQRIVWLYLRFKLKMWLI